MAGGGDLDPDGRKGREPSRRAGEGDLDDIKLCNAAVGKLIEELASPVSFPRYQKMGGWLPLRVIGGAQTDEGSFGKDFGKTRRDETRREA